MMAGKPGEVCRLLGSAWVEWQRELYCSAEDGWCLLSKRNWDDTCNYSSLGNASWQKLLPVPALLALRNGSRWRPSLVGPCIEQRLQVAMAIKTPCEIVQEDAVQFFRLADTVKLLRT
jgi:hypothetical protein